MPDLPGATPAAGGCATHQKVSSGAATPQSGEFAYTACKPCSVLSSALSPMYTQCPYCFTVYALDAATLAQASGEVMCGKCAQVFNALLRLTARLGYEPYQQLPAHPCTGRLPHLGLAIYQPRGAPADPLLDMPAPRPPHAETTAVADDVLHNAQPPDAPVVTIEHVLRIRQWPWVLACVLGALLLISQLLWWQRETLLTGLAGGWLQELGIALGYALPLPHDPTRMHIVASNIEASPQSPGALMVSITLHNDAAYVLAYPVITLQLTDAENHRIAMRRLFPADYLGNTAIERQGLPVDSDVVVVIELMDPGEQALAYDLKLE